MSLYVNGQLAGTGTNTSAWAATGPFLIGGSDNASNGSMAEFPGEISNVHVYNTALSPLAATTLNDNPPAHQQPELTTQLTRGACRPQAPRRFPPGPQRQAASQLLPRGVLAATAGSAGLSARAGGTGLISSTTRIATASRTPAAHAQATALPWTVARSRRDPRP